MNRSLLAVLALVWAAACDVDPDPFPSPPPARDLLASEDFVGAESCAGCHESAYAAWAGSTHGTAGGPPSAQTVIAPFNEAPLRFRDAVVTPVQQGRSWRFEVEWAGDAVSHEVTGVIGRGHMAGGGTQGFVTPWPDGTVRFLPFDWSESRQTWFCNTEGRANAGWLPVSDSLSLTECSDWPPRRVLGSKARFPSCQGCHGSQISVDFDAESGYHTEWTSLRVECEACHGPGAEHVEWASRAADPTSTAGSPPAADPQIRQLAALTTDESLKVCASCHTLKAQLSQGFLTGSPHLQDHFSSGFAILDQAPFTPDGRVASFAYQGTHRSSACYLDGNMSCTSCHEPHGQGYWDVNRERLIGALDDRQCTACHAAKALDPEAHTLHPVGTEGARCVSCHMPYLQHPAVGQQIDFARADHTVSIPRPLFDAAGGVGGACQGCHEEWTPAQINASIEGGWGRVKPPRPLVDQMISDGRGLPLTREAAARAWLRPELNDPVAQFTTLARFLVLFVQPDDSLEPEVAARLWDLAASDELDIQALAMAALHLAEAENPTTRRRLIAALEDNTGHDAALRRRWVAGLTFAGDQWRAETPSKAETAYLRGLELLPEQTYLLQAVGILRQAEGGDYLRAAVESDPDGPLGRVSVALFEQASGNLAAASAALDTAVALNRWEPVTHYLYGRLLLQLGDPDAGIELLERAVSLDAAYVEALQELLLALEAEGRLEDARRAAQRLLAFVPDNADALRVLGSG